MSVSRPGLGALARSHPPSLWWRITPVRPAHAARVISRNVRVYRRGWIFIASGFAEPFLYLLSIGVGLGHLVGDVRVSGRVVTYAQFVAPGLLAAQAMNGAIFDTTFNLFHKLKYAHTYEAVLATPISPAEVTLGEIGWALMRGTVYGAAFLGVMAGLGMILSPWALAGLPVAMLVSLTFASLGTAVTSYLRSWQDVDTAALALLPLFLFSGTFYPLRLYPAWLAWVVRVSPLYQGVAVLRALDVGVLSWTMAAHVAELVVISLAAIAVAARRMRRLLAP